MQPTTSKVLLLLFISCSYLFVDSVYGYAIDDSNPVTRNAAAGDYLALPPPHEHPTKEDLFDLDWEQVDERYDPRLLSEDLINESQSDSDHKDDSRRRLAEHCYFEARKYEHGQKIPRPNPCEACICVDGETFCWWKQCEPTKKATIRKKAKLFTKPFPATTGGGGSGKTATSGSAHRHGTSSSSSVTSSLAGERNRGSKKLPLKILNFPHNLPVHLSEIDLMIESDGVPRSTPKLAAAEAGAVPETSTTDSVSKTTQSSNNDRVQGPPRLTANGPITPVSETATASTTNYRDETGTGPELNSNNVLPDPVAAAVAPATRPDNENFAPWSPHPSNGDDQTAAINRNQPQKQQQQHLPPVKGDGTKAEASGAAELKRLKDQVKGGNFQRETNDEDKDEQTSAHQMTKNINDVKNNKSTIITDTRVDNEEDAGEEEQVEETKGGNGKRTPAPTTIQTTTTTMRTITTAAAAGERQRQQQKQQQWDDEKDADIDRASASVAAADEDFIRKISIEDDSPLAQHYIITSSGDIENIPLANQHIVSQFRENFINEIMPLNSVEKAVKVDMPPPTLILDTYPSPAMVTRSAGGASSSGMGGVESTAPIIVVRDDIFPSTIASGAPTLSSSYATKIFIPSGLAPSGPTNTEQQAAQKNSQESAQVWNHKESAVAAASEANSNNKARDPVCIVMGQTYRVGMVLPQEVGNCLQCVCIEGPSVEEPARVTCSPHNCPPLILPDLFDTTGY